MNIQALSESMDRLYIHIMDHGTLSIRREFFRLANIVAEVKKYNRYETLKGETKGKCINRPEIDCECDITCHFWKNKLENINKGANK